MTTVPDFDDLPPVKGMPQGCAWGVFDKGGKKDVYGTLNHLTPDVIKAAYKELRDGVSVSLNWPIGAIQTPGFGRKGLDHKVINLADALGCHGYDDEVSFNTQVSSINLILLLVLTYYSAPANGTLFATSTTSQRRRHTKASRPTSKSSLKWVQRATNQTSTCQL